MTNQTDQTPYRTAIRVDQSPAAVFDAVNNVRAWWSEEIEGITDQLNSEWDYHYQDVHRCKLRIVELIPGSRIVWEVLENHFSFTADKTEWIGNRMIFEISRTDNQTQLQFT